MKKNDVCIVIHENAYIPHEIPVGSIVLVVDINKYKYPVYCEVDSGWRVSFCNDELEKIGTL